MAPRMSTDDSTTQSPPIDTNGVVAADADRNTKQKVAQPTSTAVSTKVGDINKDSIAYITVSDPTEHHEGPLNKKYIMYRVAYDPPLPTTDAVEVDNGGIANTALFPYPTSVNRRYSDFVWLFDMLHKEKPGSIVPPLPEKQQKSSRFSESFIEDRRYHLEMFVRRVVCNPELKDTECLLVFLGGGDNEFKKAKKDGCGARSNSTNDTDDYNDLTDGVELNEHHHQHQEMGGHSLVGKGKEQLGIKKQGIKKWLKERKTSIKGTMVRSPDDAIFDQVTHFIGALEAGVKRIEAEAAASVKRDKDVAASTLAFGLGCDALAHIEDEINGSDGDASNSSGIGQTFRLIGKTSDQVSAISSEHYERGLSSFAEPLKDHLKMVHAVKVALSKRNNRRITYSTCLNAVDSKKASLHKARINQENQKVVGVESSLSRAETAVITAKTNYEEVSARCLREIDRFRAENAVAMYATMREFARMQKEYHDKMNAAWGAVLPQIESCDDIKCCGNSFAKAAADLREGKSSNGFVESVAAQVDNMSMPSYPPPPEPSANVSSTNGMESSMLNGAVRYRSQLHEE